MSDADEMTHDEWIHDKMNHDYAAAEMVAAVDSDQVADDGEVDSDHHDGEMTMICIDDGNDVAAVLFDSSNSI